MKSSTVLVVLVLALTACNNTEKKQNTNTELPAIEKFAWLVGEWSNINAETESHETWQKLNDSVLVASSITLRDKDTVFAERMKIYEENNELKLYVETVGPKPNPVVFTLKKEAEHAFTFENPRNEFPSQIVYTNPEPKKIKAWVAGFIDSLPQKQEFYFVRE